MSSPVRLPGESYDDFCRRTATGADRKFIDRLHPATKGPRFAGESEDAWRRRLLAADGLIDIDEQYPDR